MTVALVGGAGLLGRAVGEDLLARGTPFVVIDVARHSAVQLDLCTPDASERLTAAFRAAHVDRVVHLAARVDPALPSERAAMRRLHVGGLQATLDAARATAVTRVVHISSATVYGAWPDNPVPLSESAALRPNPGFSYGEDKLAQERLLATAAPTAVILRPAIIYGPGAHNYLTEIFRRSPVLPALDACRPPLQMVHVRDVASAVTTLLDGDATGAFNVAPDDWLPFAQVAALGRKRVVEIPAALLRPLHALMRFAPPHLRVPQAMQPYLMHPFVLHNARLRGLGWRPRMGCAEAIASIL